jgi:hypothetical protein
MWSVVALRSNHRPQGLLSGWQRRACGAPSGRRPGDGRNGSLPDMREHPQSTGRGRRPNCPNGQHNRDLPPAHRGTVALFCAELSKGSAVANGAVWRTLRHLPRSLPGQDSRPLHLEPRSATRSGRSTSSKGVIRFRSSGLFAALAQKPHRTAFCTSLGSYAFARIQVERCLI